MKLCVCVCVSTKVGNDGQLEVEVEEEKWKKRTRDEMGQSGTYSPKQSQRKACGGETGFVCWQGNEGKKKLHQSGRTTMNDQNT